MSQGIGERDDLGRPDYNLPKEAQTADAQADWDNPQGYLKGDEGKNEGGAEKQSSGAVEGTVANQPTEDVGNEESSDSTSSTSTSE